MSKVKIKVISRNPDDYLRATKRDIHKSKFFNISVFFYFHRLFLIPAVVVMVTYKVCTNPLSKYTI